MLVRPDGYLAWHSPGAVHDANTALRSALGLVLGRPTEALATLRQTA